MVKTFTEDGVIFDKIQDQNLVSQVDQGLATTKAGPDGSRFWEPWHFLRDYDQHDTKTNQAIRYIWERMQPVNLPDISDAGMTYYLVTGDPTASPQKLKALFDNGF